MLAGSHHGGRDQVFALLRRVAGGEVNRDVAPPSSAVVNEALHWRRRVQVIGAVSAVIDRYANHNASLGDRWSLVRQAERDTAQRRQRGPTLRVAFLYAVVVGGVVGLLMVSAQLGIAAAVVAALGEVLRQWGRHRHGRT